MPLTGHPEMNENAQSAATTIDAERSTHLQRRLYETQ